jgi:hypothetical protein
MYIPGIGIRVLYLMAWYLVTGVSKIKNCQMERGASGTVLVLAYLPDSLFIQGAVQITTTVSTRYNG